MTAVTSKMNMMVLLYMLILSMVSLPTSLPKHLLVETADNQGGDDYGHCSCFLCCWDYSKGQQNEGKLFIIPWSFIPIFRHSRQSRLYDLILMWHQEIWYIGEIIEWQITINYWTKLSPNHFTFLTESACHNQLGDIWHHKYFYILMPSNNIDAQMHTF